MSTLFIYYHDFVFTVNNSEYVFLGWKIKCAKEMELELFEWLLDIEEVPLPSELHKIGIYEEEGKRIL